MIVTFPDKDFRHYTIHFDIETGLGIYVDDYGERIDCALSPSSWIRRLHDWNIDLQALMGDYYVDEGL